MYVELPREFELAREGDFVLKLQKPLHSLKQSPLAWYEKLKGGLDAQGFKSSQLDPSLLI